MTLGILAAGADGFYSITAGFLNLLYSLTNSYGGAIILLTIVVMIVTAPLTLKSTRSMLELQRHQPELRRIQQQYKDDRERLNQEMMAFYKENNINPAAGCVPMLIQAPIFILLYGTLRGVGNRDGGAGSAIGRVAGELITGRDFQPWKLSDAVFVPDHLSTDSKLYQDLHVRNEINFFGIDLAITPLEALKIGLYTALPFFILVVLMFLAQWYQNRQIQSRNKNAQMNPQQQMMMKIMPFMLPAFSLALPAGLNLYYFVQSLCRIGLQAYITKQVYEPHHARLEQEKSAGGKKVVETTGTKKSSKQTKNGNARAGSGNKAQSPQKKTSGSKAARTGRKSGSPRAGGSTRSTSGSAKNKKG